MEIERKEKKKEDLLQARNYERASYYIKAIEIYGQYGMREDIERLYGLLEARQRETEKIRRKEEKKQRVEEERIWRGKQRKKDLHQAKNYEISLRYNDAINIYEKYEMWEEAGRCRRLQQQQKSPQSKIDIGSISHSTSISDSIIQRSSIGGTTQKKIQICPYCSEELNFPETPRYCPYCRKQILM